MARVLMINGSPHKDGNTAIALSEVASSLKADGIDSEIIHIGSDAIRGCIACRQCAKLGKCAFEDAVNIAATKFKDAQGLIVASPVYYASANGTLVSFLDRLFYSSHFDKRFKVGASVVVARRGGLSATYDELNKYFGIAGMPIATSQYWNSVHGRAPGDAKEDGEGLQTMRTLGHNMAFLIKSIALGLEKYGLPEKESPIATNFVR